MDLSLSNPSEDHSCLHPLELVLSKIRSWDSGTSQHSSHDRSLFTNFEPLPNQSPVKGLGGEVTPLGIGSIRVPCKGKQGQLAYLDLDKVLFMPGSGVNLMYLRSAAARRMPPCYRFR